MSFRTLTRSLWFLLVLLSLAGGVAGANASSQGPRLPDERPIRPALGQVPQEQHATPEIIQQAFERGEIGADERLLYLAYAVYEQASLPAQYQSQAPWWGTQAVREIHEAYSVMKEDQGLAPAPLLRTELERLLAPTGTACDQSNQPSWISSTNFRVNYGTIGGGLTIADYTTALETTFSKEVSSYKWPKPPYKSGNPWNRYPVQVVNLGGGLYGYVTSGGATYTGFVGDNPSTAVTETDAIASCMVLNANYLGFPGGALNALRVTAAHEFVHAIQFGVGDPDASEDDMFYESTAAYMEDDVYDAINDNYQFLWPSFTSCLGQYSGDVYSNWLFFRYAAELNGGAYVAGGGEDVAQAYWNNVAAGQQGLTAYNNALGTKGANLADTYHKYAIAARFMKTCPTGSPYCFKEASGYVSYMGGAPGNTANIASVGGGYNGSMQNNYALNWIGLPTSGTYDVTLQNQSSAGQFRISVVADTGGALQVSAFPSLIGGNGSVTLNSYQPPAGAQRVVAVITNQHQTAANPSSCSANPYRLSLAAASPPPPPPVGDHFVYLPLVQRGVDTSVPDGFSGKVTYQGAPAASVPLILRYYNGSSWSTYATTATNSKGDYRFSNLPPLGSNQAAYVRWDNEGSNSSRLWYWFCHAVDASSPDSEFTCNFDLQNIALGSPGSGSVVGLPQRFTWSMRSLSTDSYAFGLFDDYDEWESELLGYAGSYTLGNLPPGFFPGNQYGWDARVYGPDGFGISYNYHLVIFSGTAGPVYSEPLVRLPAAEPELLYLPVSR